MPQILTLMRADVVTLPVSNRWVARAGASSSLSGTSTGLARYLATEVPGTRSHAVEAQSAVSRLAVLFAVSRVYPMRLHARIAECALHQTSKLLDVTSL